ncbi:hypothetical protein E0Z10_g10760 [Xylaria hypoxylon]|uniref:non-specific serine/threonine protein kinase n=1 Tax=Xylaria hypoxylon TaxID=37992 RepID=A0A4Z0YE00_9PEZI|nr:hypothetical protein E0Z10_g10760 [Xylaria hypoxylon]
MASIRRVSSSAPAPAPGATFAPREFPSTGFEVINPADKIEEERQPFYRREEYYPMQIGDVVGDHYQVVAKLGYGVTSTVWLARDLRDQKFWALKVHINTMTHNQELVVYRHLASIPGDENNGQQYVRQLETSFKLNGPHGNHDVFVMTPLKMSLQSLLGARKGQKFYKDFVKAALNQVLIGLLYLHDVDVTHTGQARIGGKHRGNAMPTQYRSPEIILDMEWGSPVDLWSVGLISWDLLEKTPLFDIYDQESPEQNDAHHLAAMTALLGPPPPEFLKRSEKSAKFWNEDGQWIGPVPLPSNRTFESLAGALTEEERDLFLDFVQCFLWWVPEERLDVMHAYFHPWLGNKQPDSETEEDEA